MQQPCYTNDQATVFVWGSTTGITLRLKSQRLTVTDDGVNTGFRWGGWSCTCVFEAGPVLLMSWSDTVKRLERTEEENTFVRGVKVKPVNVTEGENQTWHRVHGGLWEQGQGLPAESGRSDTQTEGGRWGCIPPGKNPHNKTFYEHKFSPTPREQRAEPSQRRHSSADGRWFFCFVRAFCSDKLFSGVNSEKSESLL